MNHDGWIREEFRVISDERRQLSEGLHAHDVIEGGFCPGSFQFPLHHEQGFPVPGNKESSILGRAGEIEAVHFLDHQKTFQARCLHFFLELPVAALDLFPGCEGEAEGPADRRELFPDPFRVFHFPAIPVS